ncbi:MAG: hypothetical protein COX51_01055 [Syntrophobacteraceae bacterium CG23_combo_of_CG06-09_8_20_14_all_50_8]|nr:MAG: hypothetical protein COX51_01055 [Syntrophobacteraceae bacterium CG23_combo_of_CG06-09_8_20_14_all_50_8]
MEDKGYFRSKNLAQRLLGILTWAFLLVFLVVGCGYRLTPTGEKIGQDIKKVYVGVFTNNTAEANIEMTFRNAFIDQFIKGRRFKVADSEETADAVLKCDIKNLATSHLAYRSDNLAVEMRITVTMSVTFERCDTKRIIWREENFSQWEDYVADGMAISTVDIAGSEKNRENALIKLANDAAERAYRLITADF